MESNHGLRSGISRMRSLLCADAFEEAQGHGFGQRFRDPRDPNQMSFGLLQPDFTPLAISLIERLEVRDHNMAELCQHALLETSYKDPHVMPVVDSERALPTQTRRARYAWPAHSRRVRVIGVSVSAWML